MQWSKGEVQPLINVINEGSTRVKSQPSRASQTRVAGDMGLCREARGRGKET